MPTQVRVGAVHSTSSIWATGHVSHGYYLHGQRYEHGSRTVSERLVVKALSLLACPDRRRMLFSCTNAAKPAISPWRSANLWLLKISTRCLKSIADTSSSSFQPQRWCRIRHRDMTRWM